LLSIPAVMIRQLREIIYSRTASTVVGSGLVLSYQYQSPTLNLTLPHTLSRLLLLRDVGGLWSEHVSDHTIVLLLCYTVLILLL
jgi:hypothetical protein